MNRESDEMYNGVEIVRMNKARWADNAVRAEEDSIVSEQVRRRREKLDRYGVMMSGRIFWGLWCRWQRKLLSQRSIKTRIISCNSRYLNKIEHFLYFSNSSVCSVDLILFWIIALRNFVVSGSCRRSPDLRVREYRTLGSIFVRWEWTLIFL